MAVKKKQTSISNLVPKNPETINSIGDRNTKGLFEFIVYYEVTENVLFHIFGYMIQNPVKSTDRHDCPDLIVQSTTSHHCILLSY